MRVYGNKILKRIFAPNSKKVRPANSSRTLKEKYSMKERSGLNDAG
jgi:hypothetical protein